MNRFFRRSSIHRLVDIIFIFEKRLRESVIRGVADSPYRWYGESLFEEKNKFTPSIFRTLSSSVSEYFVHVVGFYLNLAIFATWKSFQHGLINYIDIKAKCHNLKNWPVKGLCGRCLFVWGPPYTLYTYFILIHTGKGLRGGEELNQRED